VKQLMELFRRVWICVEQFRCVWISVEQFVSSYSVCCSNFSDVSFVLAQLTLCVEDMQFEFSAPSVMSVLGSFTL
jgi:hypothetical protein